MGEINLDNTGSGNAITLSSDGSSLLLNGSAIGGGGGGADLYAANESSPNAQPSALGNNAIAIGNTTKAGTQASHANAIAIGGSDNTSQPIQATNTFAVAIGTAYYGAVTASSDGSMAIGTGATVASASGSLALGKSSTAAGNSAVSLSVSYASGANSLAAAIDNSTSSYGATGANSVAIGEEAKATGANSVAISSKKYSGGATASGAGCVAIGDGAQATGLVATAIGRNALASNTHSIAIGKDSISANQETMALGYKASADGIGNFAFASGTFGAANGDAQGKMYILRKATTDATATVLTTDAGNGSNQNQVKVPTNGAVVFDGVITGLESGVNSYAGWRVEGMIVNDAGTTTLANAAITTIHNTPNWGLTLTADNSLNSLAITVTGEASHNIRWVANIRTVETIYA